MLIASDDITQPLHKAMLAVLMDMPLVYQN
jgi:hypothetical protein